MPSQPGCAGLVQAKAARVFADRRKMTGGLALVLYPKKHDNLGIGEGGLEVVGDLDTEIGEPMWHQRGGTAEGDGGAHLCEGMDVGACDAAEKNIAQDDDLAALEAAEVLLHGERV